MEFTQAVAAIALLAGNFYFVAVEFSIASARSTMVDNLAEQGVAGAASLQHGVTHIDAYLSACQLGITICSIGLGITAEPLVAHALESVFPEGVIFGVESGLIAFIIAYGAVSVFHVVLGELAPKSLAIARTEKVGLLLLPPMRGFYMATKPVVDALNWLGNITLKPFGIPPASEAGHSPHSREELETLISRSEEAGVLEPEQRSFAEGAFSFGDRRAREVMVPRGEVALLGATDSIDEAVSVALRTGHTRFPLGEGEGGLDATIGMVHVLPLLKASVQGQPADLKALSSSILWAADVTLLDELLEQMRHENRHMAILTDEFGTAVGIVTLEDVLEEIVGDIRDEYDPGPEPVVERMEDGGLRIPGDMPLHQVSREIDINIEERREATLGGYVTERLGRTPHPGENLTLDGWQATVGDVSEAVVRSVTLRQTGDSGDNEQSEEGGNPPS